VKLLIGILFFLCGQVAGWYQLNLQKMYDWWADKAILSAILVGVPTSILFWYGWKYISEATGSVWSARFIGSSAGFVVFPILTWFMLGESMFTAKTLVCLALSILIILIQIFY
tara:strand:+ start:7387 stop:7725 length:339 start_codon:yes stop_codon:yes gene_type:complete